MFLFAAFCLLPALGFFVFHISTPADGARLSKELNIFNDRGAVISPYVSLEGPLLEGDVVTAVDGVAVEVWSRALFTGGIERPEWKFGDVVMYDVLREGRSLRIEVPLVRFPWAAVLRSHWGALLFAFVSQIVAGFVYLKRREDPAAQALLIWALSGSHTYAWSVFLQVGDIVGGAGFWLFRLATPLLWLIYWPASTHVALMFPRPLRAVRSRPGLVAGLYAVSFALYFGLLAWNWFRFGNLLVWLSSWGATESIIAGIFLLTTMAAVFIQQRASRTAEERQQIRWVVYGVFVSGMSGLVFWFGYPIITGRSAIDANLLGLLALPFPLTLAVAIWRHRLFDIDVIIRRTLQYSIVSLLLAGTYFAGVVLLQAVFQALSGSADSAFVTVLTTLGIAAMFNPLRTRVQRFIDQRFFRTSYNAEEILNRFTTIARDEVNLEMLGVAVMAAVDESVQPEHVSLWIRLVQRKPPVL